MQLQLSFKRRFKQLQNALKHGGITRMLDVISERQRFGYSTRALSYSWPKPVFLHSRLTKEQSCHFLMPHLLETGAYGGIATLAKLVVEFAQNYDRTFVYLTDFPGSKLSLKTISRCQEDLWQKISPKIEVIDCSTSNFINLVGNLNQDHFVATAWWTKASLDPIKDRLRPDQLTYIVQDEESLFYDPSDEVEAKLKKLALNSYTGRYRAIINSQFLADYLVQQKLISGAHDIRVLAPQIQEDLFFEIPGKKEKLIFVYARPDVRRNRFDLCVESLKALVEEKKLVGWKIVGAGSLKKDVYLGEGKFLEAIGKLDLHAYADLAQRSSVALCLMETPHPSYPPLELARAGALVVCNRYANKDYSVLGPNFYCTDLEVWKLTARLKQAVIDTKLMHVL